MTEIMCIEKGKAFEARGRSVISVGRKMSPKDLRVPVLATCGYIAFHDKEEFKRADGMEFAHQLTLK